jgi:23S rRNA pseudouridine2605 synthase
MRINKFLAACGLGSRRKVEEIVLAGRVTVNGNQITDLSTFVEPGRDRVMVDGRAARLPEGHTYYLLHKPEGIMTTARDPEGRSTVLQLVPLRPRVFPVGRLDRETSGALLLTDDGALAHRILHPRYGVEKEYIAVVEGTITDEATAALREGVLLDGERRPTAPAQVDVLDRKNKRSRVRLIVHEGRNRQVRRMLEAVGHRVLSLRRERIGPVSLGNLDAGGFRVLTPNEVAALRRETARARPRATAPRRPARNTQGEAKHAVRRTRKAPAR